jgi:hypothetical protein
MKLDTAEVPESEFPAEIWRKNYNEIWVTMDLTSAYNEITDACSLHVEVAHDKDNSDATLQFSTNEYVAGNPLDGDYSGNTTLANGDGDKIGNTTSTKLSQAFVKMLNDQISDMGQHHVGTATVKISPSSFPYRYEDNSGAKLHTGRLGVTLSVYVICTGVGIAPEKRRTKFYLEDWHSNAKGRQPGETAHPFYYDLKADGATLTSQDQAGANAGTLKNKPSYANTGKRAYEYSASFQHYHDQVRFPNASITGESHQYHFESVADPLSAHCQWDHGTFVGGINYDALRQNGWMSDKDGVTPTQAYDAWAADECVAGVCKKYRKDATVVSLLTAGDTAYLPFDKPLESYYTTAPKVKCNSQNPSGTVVGIVAGEVLLAPDIATDTAPPIYSGLQTSFSEPTVIACQDDTGNPDICVIGADTLAIKDNIFAFDVVTTDFTDLLNDKYDFRAVYTCDSDVAADPCVIETGSSTDNYLFSTLKRTSDADNLSLAQQLEAKANTVLGYTFTAPTKYGTTFNNYKASLSGLDATSGADYRTRGNFSVQMLLLDSDSNPATGVEQIQWTGGPVNTPKDFEGFNTTDRFDKRDPEIITQTRVKTDALLGYYTSHALFVDVNGIGIMSPFNEVGDLAVPADGTEKANLEGKNDELIDSATGDVKEMGPNNKFYAVKSYCCGKDGDVTVNGASLNCQASRAGDLAAGDLAADDPAASTYCRTNGFDAVRCLSSELSVKYTVQTKTFDDRFAADEVVATRTYTNAAIASLSQAEQAFNVANSEYDAVTAGAGVQAGSNTFDYNVNSAYMGQAKSTLNRVSYDAASEVETYNCDEDGRDIAYSMLLPTPCGESELPTDDPSYMSKYTLSATVKAHYVYTASSPDQVSQTTSTGTIGTKDTGAEAYANPDNSDTDKDWLTTEWRVQDSSDPGSEAKGSGTPIELKVIIANDVTVASYDSDFHMPSSKVFIVDDTTLKVTGMGNVTLKADSCTTTAGGETSCILEYTNNEVMSINDGTLCDDEGEPACPVIQYTIAANVKNGGSANGATVVANAFGADEACAPTETSTATQIGGIRQHKLYVVGNPRAYDGVIGVQAIEKDPYCLDFCERVEGRDDNGAIYSCMAGDYTATNQNFRTPDVNTANNYCINPYPLATETLHDVAVPGKDGAAVTILDVDATGTISTSKDLSFEVHYLKIGEGLRTFTITGLTEGEGGVAVPTNLPKPVVCPAEDLNANDKEGCVRDRSAADAQSAQNAAAQQIATESQRKCPDTLPDCNITTEGIDNIGVFRLALGDSKLSDVCANSKVGVDPYTVNGVKTLGFSIKVTYATNDCDGNTGIDCGTGPPDTGVEHKFYFSLSCPQKEYSLNLVTGLPMDSNAVRANIIGGADIGLVNKDNYGESHWKYLTMFPYFSGRSSETYKVTNSIASACDPDDVGDSNTVCHKAMIRLADNDDVKFRITPTQPNIISFDNLQGIFLDDAEDFESLSNDGGVTAALSMEFEFKEKENPCLFTTIKLISKVSPLFEGNYIDNTADKDKTFEFRVQCPRFSTAVATDALDLKYDISGITFGGSGGSVSTTQQTLVGANNQVKPFTAITTSLRGPNIDSNGALASGGGASLCDDRGSVDNTCVFPTVGSGTTSALARSSQQEWLAFLLACGFKVNNAGAYEGWMERKYERESLLDGGTQDYCSGRHLSFSVVTEGTHTATISVESPVSMQFAVQIDELYWKEATQGDPTSCDVGDYYLMMKATIYRKQDTDTAWSKATSTTITEPELTGFFKNGNNDDAFGDNAKFTAVTGGVEIQGMCKTLVVSDDSSDNCAAFESARQVTFGTMYTQYGVDYRGGLSLNLEMTCPTTTKAITDEQAISLSHSTCTGNFKSDTFDNCPTGNGTVQVSANGQVRLTLSILDEAFQSHTVSSPTYTIQGTVAGIQTSGLVTSLCDALETDCAFMAKDGNENGIPLVAAYTYTGTDAGRLAEENSVVTLRALPLSGAQMTISWTVTRIISGRRLLRQYSYTLGAAASNGLESASFTVIPATREEDAGIAVGAGTEELEETQGTERSGTSHTEKEEKEEEDTSPLMYVLYIALGIVAVVVIGFAIKQKADSKKDEAEEGNAGAKGGPANNFMKSRFYQYTRLDKGGDQHMEDLWKRNRFNSNSESRFL